MRGLSYIFTTLDFAFAVVKKNLRRSTIRSRCFIKAERRFELTPRWRKLSHTVKPANRVCKSLAWGALPSRSFVLSLSPFLFSTLHLPQYLQSPVTRAQLIGRGSTLYFFFFARDRGTRSRLSLAAIMNRTARPCDCL